MRVLDSVETGNWVRARLPINARVAVLAKKNEVFVGVSVGRCHAGLRTGTIVGGCVYVRDVADDDDRIIVGRFGEELDLAFRHGATSCGAAPKELERPIGIVPFRCGPWL